MENEQNKIVPLVLLVSFQIPSSSSVDFPVPPSAFENALVDVKDFLCENFVILFLSVFLCTMCLTAMFSLSETQISLKNLLNQYFFCLKANCVIFLKNFPLYA